MSLPRGRLNLLVHILTHMYAVRFVIASTVVAWSEALTLLSDGVPISCVFECFYLSEGICSRCEQLRSPGVLCGMCCVAVGPVGDLPRAKLPHETQPQISKTFERSPAISRDGV